MGTEVKKLVLMQSELDLMNKLVLTLVDVDHLVEKVTDNMSHDMESQPDIFLGFDDEVSITEDDVDKYIESAFQSEYDWEDNIPTVIYEAVHEKIGKKAIEEMDAEIKEIFEDMREFQRDPLGYYGMKEADFI